MKKNIAVMAMQLKSGGAERIAGLLTKYLSDIYNVYLFLLDSSNISYDYGGKIVDISLFGINYEETVKRLKRQYKIDCAISFSDEMNSLNIRTRTGESVIISNRISYGEMVPFPQGMKIKTGLWYDKADKIVSCSYGAKYDLVHYFNIDSDLICPIYNFIDKDKIIAKSHDALPKEVLAFKGDSKLIINVGRLEKQKNQRKLLVQFSKLVSEGYDIKLIILGSGALEKELKELANDLKISNHVRFETYCKDPFPYYRIADIMAFSTDYEGLPNVILEAFTLGLPVVSVDCLSGPRELIKGSTEYENRTTEADICERGVLVEKADSDATGKTHIFADGLKKLLDNDDLCNKISDNCLSYMKSYTNEAILEEWFRIIESTSPHTDTILPEPFETIWPQKKVIVYGAGKVGKMIMQHLISSNRNFDFLCFAVSEISENPVRILDVPVYDIKDLQKHKDDSVVIIGVSAQYEYDVCQKLSEYGFKYIFSEL